MILSYFTMGRESSYKAISSDDARHSRHDKKENLNIDKQPCPAAEVSLLRGTAATNDQSGRGNGTRD